MADSCLLRMHHDLDELNIELQMSDDDDQATCTWLVAASARGNQNSVDDERFSFRCTDRLAAARHCPPPPRVATTTTSERGDKQRTTAAAAAATALCVRLLASGARRHRRVLCAAVVVVVAVIVVMGMVAVRVYCCLRGVDVAVVSLQL